MNRRGFTLIELLVVIAILAILSTIAISVFGGAQRSARDGKVRAEIMQIGKSIEASRSVDDTGGVIYSYNVTAFQTDFKSPRPMTSPGATKYEYCYRAADTAVSDVPTWNNDLGDLTTVCNTNSGWAKINDVNMVLSGKYWKVCGRLEGTGIPVCASSANP